MRKPMSTAIQQLKPSGIRRINALAAARPGCIALALGEPEFGTPRSVSMEATRSLDEGLTHYPPNNGTASLRAAIARTLAADGIERTADEVIVTVGATEALSATLATLLDPGDEVVIPTPAFGLYESLVTMLRGVPVFLDTAPAGFQIGEEALAAAVTPRTKAIVIT